MKQNKAYVSVLLLCCALMSFVGCAGQESTANPYAEDAPPQVSDAPAEENQQTEEEAVKPQQDVPVSKTKDDGTSDIHVTVPSIEISLTELQAQDYIVPVYIALEENAGITYSEWGLSYDPRCTVEAGGFDEQVFFDTVCSVNNEKHFLWTAWSSANVRENTGNMLLINVQLPEDAAAGDSYFINYASFSLADLPHAWAVSGKSWVSEGYISWTDGGITVTE